MTTPTGSGTGTPGGIPEFSLLSDQSAASSVLRASMGIINNLDTIIFTDLNKKALWKYDTSSSKPTLHPLEHVRADTSPPRVDDSWKQILQELINHISDATLREVIRRAYERNLHLPPEVRYASLMIPSLIAFARLLEGTAKVLSWIQNSIYALDPQNPIAGPGSETDARRSMNQALSTLVMKGITTDSQVTFQSVRDELLKIGSNNPHFNELTGILNQVGAAYTIILNTNEEAA